MRAFQMSKRSVAPLQTPRMNEPEASVSSIHASLSRIQASVPNEGQGESQVVIPAVGVEEKKSVAYSLSSNQVLVPTPAC
jgi:hypothetical protein